VDEEQTQRRNNGDVLHTYTHKDYTLKINETRRYVSVDGQTRRLPALQFWCLLVITRKAGAIATDYDLLTKVEPGLPPREAAVMAHQRINVLRKRLPEFKDAIRRVQMFGYRWAPAPKKEDAVKSIKLFDLKTGKLSYYRCYHNGHRFDLDVTFQTVKVDDLPLECQAVGISYLAYLSEREGSSVSWSEMNKLSPHRILGDKSLIPVVTVCKLRKLLQMLEGIIKTKFGGRAYTWAPDGRKG